MLDRAAGARIVLYVALAWVAWYWLSGIKSGGEQDANETAALRQVAQVLAGHDAYAHRQAQLVARAQVFMRDAQDAKRLADREGVARVEAQNRLADLLVEGDSAGALTAAEQALDAAAREVSLLGHGFNQCVAAFEDMRTAAKGCEARADSLRALVSLTGQLLKQRRTFRVGFLTLPRPTKWQAALGGGLLGALLDQNRLRGLTAGGLGTVLLVPTR